jgi:anaerobic magnesium-protoporphyrin IX monomethyl ester cyclase
MRILLVYPAPPRSTWPKGDFRSMWVPDGLAMIATVLRRAGHKVAVHVREQVLDQLRFDWAEADARLRRLLEEFRPEMVGLSVNTPAAPEAGAIASLAKQLCGRHVTVVAGGPHPTAIPEEFLRECPDVDVVVIGEGELAMAELAEKGPGREVTGLVYRDGEGFVHTPPRPPVTDLDTLGPPAYDLFDMDYYTKCSRWLVRYIPLRATNVRTSRGCTNRCLFCAGHLVGGLGLRYHSIPYVVEQVRAAVDRWGVEAIRFEDDTLGGDRGRLLALCEALRAAGLDKRVKWDGCLRVDQADPEVLAAMKAAGCIQVEFGFESGSTESLRRLGKSATADLNRRAVRLAHEAGLRVFADIMVGLPGESREDLEATVRFLRWARPDVIVASRLYPLPGTPIYAGLSEEARGRLGWDAYSYFDQDGGGVNLTALPDEEFRRWFRSFRRYFIRPQIMWSILRDTPREWKEDRRALRRTLARFALLHPIRAVRVPW